MEANEYLLVGIALSRLHEARRAAANYALADLARPHETWRTRIGRALVQAGQRLIDAPPRVAAPHAGPACH